MDRFWHSDGVKVEVGRLNKTGMEAFTHAHGVSAFGIREIVHSATAVLQSSAWCQHSCIPFTPNAIKTLFLFPNEEVCLLLSVYGCT